MTKNSLQKETHRAKIIKCVGGLYLVRTDDGSYVRCRARGNFRYERTTPTAGDIVQIELCENSQGYILSIEERKNSLIRPHAANIDMLLLVCACRAPDPDLFFIDKMTSVAAANNIEIMLVITKADISEADAENIRSIYTLAGIDCVCLSTKEPEKYGAQFSSIKQKLCGKVTFAAGVSGAGKSSLINYMFPDLKLVSGELSAKTLRGKNTTRTTELYEISPDTYIADTPGFSMFELCAGKQIDKDSLIFTFPDILEYSEGCRYTKCTHLCEEGCAVVRAREEGKISASRHESYCKLYNQMKKTGKWEYK